ncbi:MAG: hypothetical protein RR365_00935 [Bacteroides sp.]
MADLEAGDMPLVTQYYAYVNAGTEEGFISAAALINANPGLQPKIFNAAKFNKSIDGLLAVQTYFKEQLQNYLNEQLTYKEPYNPATAYKKTNIVDFGGEGFICRLPTSTGVAPVKGTTTANWALISKQGIQGVSGTGLAPRGLWLSTETYYANDCVADSNALWQCLTGNTNSKPSVGSAKWIKLIDVDLSLVTTHMNNSTIHVSQEEKASWNGKQNALTLDTAPTSGSANPITSGGVYEAIHNFSSCPFVVSTSAPANTQLLWIDSSSGIMKYHNGTAWVIVKAAWGS